MAFFRLIRLPNLFVVAMTQWLIYHEVLCKAFQKHGLSADLSFDQFICLVIATCSVTAAGYIINDIADIEIDRVNRPAHKWIAGHLISERTVQWLCFIFLILGFIESTFLGLVQDALAWLWLYPIAAILLAYYPYRLKKHPFWGNLLIAIFCAGMPLLVFLAEWNKWKMLKNFSLDLHNASLFIILLFAGFAFLSTYMRELVKDIEDMEGDQRFSRQTFPVTYGVVATKRFIILLAGLLAGLLTLPIVLQIGNFEKIPLLLISCILLSFFPFLFYLLYNAGRKSAYTRISLLLKFYMLGGLLLLVFYQV